GKTALKANVSKYVLGYAVSAGNQLISLSPFNVVLTATRPWTDNNNNFSPDCDLTNPAAQGPTAATGQVGPCGAVTGTGSLMYENRPGSQNPGDDDSRYGWQKGAHRLEFSLSAHAGLSRRVSHL